MSSAVPWDSAAAASKTDVASLGLKSGDVGSLVKQIRTGFSFEKLVRFQKQSQLPLSAITNLLEIPPRTLARRKVQGKLTRQESERLLRYARIFEQAVGLFENDTRAAVGWLTTPNKALGNQPPLEVARTEIGAREVEDLIGRLEFGVYS